MTTAAMREVEYVSKAPYCDICGVTTGPLTCCKTCPRAFCRVNDCGQLGPAAGQEPGCYDTCNVCLGKGSREQKELFR